MLTADEIKGVVAVIPTPAKPGAESVLAMDTVDLDETSSMIEKLIRDGADSLMALGTTGECATLSDEDYRKFVDCVLTTVNHRIPTFMGATALGTHEMVKRIKFVKEQGADATLLGIPMWQPATLDMAVQHYADLSAAFPDFGIMVYCNARAFRFPFGLDFWQGIAQKAPTVMAAKFSQAQIIKEAVEATEGRVAFVSGGQGAYRLAKVCPDDIKAGWWLAAGLSPAKALMDAILSKDFETADKIAEEMEWSHEPQRSINTVEIFASFNIQFNRVFMEASGYCKPGPIRPPYIYSTMPKHFYDACWESGKRWAQLEEKYAAMRKQAVGGGEA